MSRMFWEGRVQLLDVSPNYGQCQPRVQFSLGLTTAIPETEDQQEALLTDIEASTAKSFGVDISRVDAYFVIEDEEQTESRRLEESDTYEKATIEAVISADPEITAEEYQVEDNEVERLKELADISETIVTQMTNPHSEFYSSTTINQWMDITVLPTLDVVDEQGNEVVISREQFSSLMRAGTNITTHEGILIPVTSNPCKTITCQHQYTVNTVCQAQQFCDNQNKELLYGENTWEPSFSAEKIQSFGDGCTRKFSDNLNRPVEDFGCDAECIRQIKENYDINNPSGQGNVNGRTTTFTDITPQNKVHELIEEGFDIIGFAMDNMQFYAADYSDPLKRGSPITTIRYASMYAKLAGYNGDKNVTQQKLDGYQCDLVQEWESDDIIDHTNSSGFQLDRAMRENEDKVNMMRVLRQTPIIYGWNAYREINTNTKRFIKFAITAVYKLRFRQSIYDSLHFFYMNRVKNQRSDIESFQEQLTKTINAAEEISKTTLHNSENENNNIQEDIDDKNIIDRDQLLHFINEFEADFEKEEGQFSESSVLVAKVKEELSNMEVQNDNVKQLFYQYKFRVTNAGPTKYNAEIRKDYESYLTNFFIGEESFYGQRGHEESSAPPFTMYSTEVCYREQQYFCTSETITSIFTKAKFPSDECILRSNETDCVDNTNCFWENNECKTLEFIQPGKNVISACPPKDFDPNPTVYDPTQQTCYCSKGDHLSCQEYELRQCTWTEDCYCSTLDFAYHGAKPTKISNYTDTVQCPTVFS